MRDVARTRQAAAARIGEAEYRVQFDLGADQLLAAGADGPAAARARCATGSALRWRAAPAMTRRCSRHEGVPTAMIFVRNENGSHNPEEAMDMEDFAVATRALSALLGRAVRMTLLVTGATGFVMSVLARHWLEADPARARGRPRRRAAGRRGAALFRARSPTG